MYTYIYTNDEEIIIDNEREAHIFLIIFGHSNNFENVVYVLKMIPLTPHQI